MMNQHLEDLKQMFSSDEHAETVSVNGVQTCIIIEERKTAKSKGFGDYERSQVNVLSIKFHIIEADLGSPAIVGSEIEIDGGYYEITAVDSVSGVSIITAEVRR